MQEVSRRNRPGKRGGRVDKSGLGSARQEHAADHADHAVRLGHVGLGHFKGVAALVEDEHPVARRHLGRERIARYRLEAQERSRLLRASRMVSCAVQLPAATWAVGTLVNALLFSGCNSLSTVPPGRASKAALVGAKTVKGPLPQKSLDRAGGLHGGGQCGAIGGIGGVFDEGLAGKHRRAADHRGVGRGMAGGKGGAGHAGGQRRDGMRVFRPDPPFHKSRQRLTRHDGSCGPVPPLLSAARGVGMRPVSGSAAGNRRARRRGYCPMAGLVNR